MTDEKKSASRSWACHSNFVLVAQGQRSPQTTKQFHLNDLLVWNSIIVVASSANDACALGVAVMSFGNARNESDLLVSHGL